MRTVNRLSLCALALGLPVGSACGEDHPLNAAGAVSGPGTNEASTTTTRWTYELEQSTIRLVCSSVDLINAEESYKGTFNESTVGLMINEMGRQHNAELKKLGQELETAANSGAQHAVLGRVLNWCGANGHRS